MSRLSIWNPYRRSEPVSLMSPWSDMMERFFAPMAADAGSETNWFPKMDVKETPESFVIQAETPGLTAEETNVSVVGDTLTISGEKRREEKKEKDQWHWTERSYGSFHRSFTFPVPVDSDHVEAGLKNGVLHVVVAKSKRASSKKVTVQTHS